MTRLFLWVRSHSLSLVLLFIFSSMLTSLLIMGPSQYRAEGVSGSYWQWWIYQLILSLVADVWGALILVLFTKWFWERRSAESHDPPQRR